MTEPKEKRVKSSIPVREPHKRTKTGIFDNLRPLPHPIEEILRDFPIEPRDKEASEGQSSVKFKGPLKIEGPLITVSPVNIAGLSNIERPAKDEAKALQITSPLESESPVKSREALTGQSPSDLAELSFARRPDFSLLNSLPETAGYELAFHQVTDYLYRQLATAEQAIYRQLYRLTWGFGRPRVLIGFPKLAERANVGESTARAAAKALESKGLIKRQGMVFGLNHEQGIEWEVYPPPALVKYLKSQARKRRRGSESESPSDSESPLDFEPMKDNVLLNKHTHTRQDVSVLSRFSLEECRRYADHLKQTGQGITNPGGYATKIFRSGEADVFIEAFSNPPTQIDIRTCQDCRGTGFIYVDQLNHDRGVKQCKHTGLTQQPG
jgi:hypothetical protein